MINVADGRRLLAAQVGKPYVFGYEVKLEDPNPTAFDCSELVQWFHHQFGIVVPDGSYNQYDKSVPAEGPPQPFDLGFLKKPNGGVFHVVMRYDDNFLIQAHSTLDGVVITPILPMLNHRWLDVWAGWRRFNA